MLKALLGVAFTVVWLAGCSDSAPTTPQAPLSVTLTPSVDTPDAVGDTRQLVASVAGSSSARIAWQSSDATTVDNNSSGTITARKAGDARITARAGSLSATARIAVRPPAAVVVVNALRTPMGASTFRVTAALRNLGGRGVYSIDFYGRPANLVNPPSVLVGSTEQSRLLRPMQSLPRGTLRRLTLELIVVRTREPNTAIYRETARFTF